MSVLKKLLDLVVKYPFYAIVAALLAYITVQGIELRHAHARERTLGLEKLVLQAKADSTRDVSAQEKKAIVHLFGVYATGVQRLIIQTRDSNTRLGKSLGQETKLAGDLVLMVRDLNAQLTSKAPVVTDAADVRHAEFQVDSIHPYHVIAKVALPPSPGRGVLNLWIGQDTTYLHIHAGCLPKNSDGLRPASLTVVADSFRLTRIGQVTQDQEVCNPAKMSFGSRAKHDVILVGVGAASVSVIRAVLRLLKLVP